MNLQHQIKTYRTSLQLTQDDLGDKIFVSRQTISNWENGKNYPDIHSLLLLSELFGISLDQLVKGDLDIIKELIGSNEIKQFTKLGNIFTTLFILFIISFAPLVHFFHTKGFIISIILFTITIYFAIKVEKCKKHNDMQTYQEILAFMNGEKLDTIVAGREKKKRPYQKAFLALGSALIAIIVYLVFYKLFALLG